MYLRYFGFEDYPFAVTPDPAFLYLSESHREALAHLLYGAGEHGGFVSLIGEVGTGKTTLIRAVLDSELADLDIALCWNPQLEVREFVASICDELGVINGRDPMASLKSLTDRLNAHLLKAHAANRRTVLIVDEAQNLSRDVLEQLRLLTNLETHRHKLLRIILVGQPELGDLLARHDLRQLSQRITARFVLKPLNTAETRAYVQHRLACANGPQHLFTSTATVGLRAVTGGVPRLINMVCERALMGAYAHNHSQIGVATVLRAAYECLPPRYLRLIRGGRRMALPTGLLAAGIAVVLLAWLPDIPLTSAAEKTSDTAPAIESESKPVVDSASNENTPDPSAGDDTPDQSVAGQDADAPAPDRTTSSESEGDDDAGAGDSEPQQDKRAQPQAGQPDTTGAGGASSPHEHPGQDTLPKGNAKMSQLLRLWGVFGADVQSQCERLRIGDLRCLDDDSSLAIVARYNRPALVTLEVDGQRQTVLLTALGDEKATIVGSDGTRDITRRALEAHWGGRVRIVWRADAGVA